MNMNVALANPSAEFTLLYGVRSLQHQVKGPISEINDLLRLCDWALAQNDAELTAAVPVLHNHIRTQLQVLTEIIS